MFHKKAWLDGEKFTLFLLYGYTRYCGDGICFETGDISNIHCDLVNPWSLQCIQHVNSGFRTCDIEKLMS